MLIYYLLPFGFYDVRLEYSLALVFYDGGWGASSCPLMLCFMTGQKGPRSPLQLLSFVNSPPPVSLSLCLPAGKIKRCVYVWPKVPTLQPIDCPHGNKLIWSC